MTGNRNGRGSQRGAWATKTRLDRLNVLWEADHDLSTAIAGEPGTITDAVWWISYRDQDVATVWHHFREGVNLKKIQREQVQQQERQQAHKDRTEVIAYHKKELAKEKQAAENSGKGGDC